MDGSRLWAGSLNWTEDAFALQENCFLIVEDVAIASMYLANFEELWTSREVEGTGAHDHETRSLECKGDTVGVRPIFCRGRGPELASEIAERCATRANES